MATKKAMDIVADQLDIMQTFNPLSVALKENDKKNLFNTNAITAFIRTGYPLIDYYFGSLINVHDELGKLIRQEPRIGQAAGTFNLIVGASGSGKSTLAEQIAAYILRQFKLANVIHFDTEQRTDISRIESVTKLPIQYFASKDGSTPRYMLKSGAVSLSMIQAMLVQMAVTKIRLREQIKINMGYNVEFGKPVIILPPTIVIIDSITSVIDETFNVDNSKEVKDAEKMRSNTEGARDAKTLKGFFKDILPLCKEADIIIYGINHINTNMSMNAFTPVARQQNYLKQDESIPGGKTMLYYPYNIIKLTALPSDNFTMESDGFEGHLVRFEPIKSSSNQSGNDSKGISFEQVFSFKEGFDSLRSLILYGRENGFIEGNKTRYKFKNDPECTFSWKNIYNELNEKPIWKNTKEIIIPHLETHLPWIENKEFNDCLLDY